MFADSEEKRKTFVFLYFLSAFVSVANYCICMDETALDSSPRSYIKSVKVQRDESFLFDYATLTTCMRCLGRLTMTRKIVVESVLLFSKLGSCCKNN